MKTISLIGSTGSIGTQTLEVCEKHNIRVKALAAKRNVALLAEQAHKFNVEYVCVFDEEKYDELKKLMSDTDAEVLCGMDGLCKAAQLDNIDLFVNSVVGMVGLLPTLKAIEAGIDVALANKETLVAGGELVMRSAAEKRVVICRAFCRFDSKPYRYRLVNVRWSYEYVDYSDLDFVIIANEPNGIWQMAALGKGGKVAVFRYGGQEKAGSIPNFV